MVFDGVNLSNGYAYPGGYCTRRCYTQAQCGSTGKCIYYLGILGDMENICLSTCTGPGTQGSCRSGYICAPFGTSTGNLCIVAGADGGYMDDFDAGPGANDNVMGQSCANDQACQPPASGSCIPETFDGGPTGYIGGSCTADCSMSVSDEWCGHDAGTCLPAAYSTQQGPLVIWGCERLCNPMNGNTGCRTSYVCELQNPSYPDYGVCHPNCTNAGYQCPSGTCNATNGLCE
jgi:hypothetical protein